MAVSRYSRQRELIYEKLKSSKEHPTAEQIYQELKRDNPALSLGTVYRNLNLLTDEGKAIRIPFSVDRYDGNTQEHPHFFCTQCGKLYDIEISAVGDLNQLVSAMGYQVERHDLIFRGICLSCCAQKEKRETKN